MENKHYFHFFANGDDAKNFITTEHEFKTAFNRFGLCGHRTGVNILSFSVEDTHPHALLWGSEESVYDFGNQYESLSRRCIARRRGSLDGVDLHCDLYEIHDERYLMNVAAYSIVQATKDGKAVMPYDYRYGTGALYFRSKYTILPWLVDEEGKVCQAREFGSVAKRDKKDLLGSSDEVPSDWLVCNGFVLPTNYVDVDRFEKIFKTHNCFRAFLSSGKGKDSEILLKMSEIRGVSLDDFEARNLCHQMCMKLFGRQSTRTLDTEKRILLAQTLRRKYKISYRQLENLVYISETELRKYVK